MNSALLIADYHDKEDTLKSIRHNNLIEVLNRHISYVNKVYFLGDNFNSSSPVFKLVQEFAEIIDMFKPYHEKIAICNGNHCSIGLTTSPIHSYCLGAGIRHVASEEYCDDNFVLRGWNTAKPIARQRTHELFFAGHVALEFPPHLIGHSRYSIDELSKLGYNAMFLGDSHTEGDYRNIYSVGTFAPVNFSDVDLKACYGIVEWNGKDYKFTRHYINYPVYKIIRLDYSNVFDLIDRFKEDISGNCIRIDISNCSFVDTEFKNKLSEIVQSFNPFQFKLDFLPKVEMETKAKITTETLEQFIEQKVTDWPKECKEYFDKNRNAK